MTPIETVVLRESVSLTLSVHEPAETDVTVSEPFATAPAVTMPSQPLTV